MSINHTSQPLGQREEWRRVTVDLEGQIEDIQKKKNLLCAKMERTL